MAAQRMIIEVLLHYDSTTPLIVSGCESDIADRLHKALPRISHETELVGWLWEEEDVDGDDDKCVYVYYKNELRIAFHCVIGLFGETYDTVYAVTCTRMPMDCKTKFGLPY